MSKAVATLANLTGVAALMVVGYAIIRSIPDIKRYIRISTM
jgi:exosortase/archaeosortase